MTTRVSVILEDIEVQKVEEKDHLVVTDLNNTAQRMHFRKLGDKFRLNSSTFLEGERKYQVLSFISENF